MFGLGKVELGRLPIGGGPCGVAEEREEGGQRRSGEGFVGLESRALPDGPR